MEAPVNAQPAEENMVPFPVAEASDANNMTNSQSAASNQESEKTNSSTLTSSDKLTALPTSVSMSPNLNRFMRSPTSSRTHGRSLDTSLSLPSDLEFGGSYGSPSHTWRNRTHSSVPPSSASDGNETPKRVSFDSDRISLPTIQSVRQAFSRVTRGNDSAASPALRSSAMEQKENLDTPSHSRSRATSPLRLLQQWSAGLRSHYHAQEDPFIPVDPFRLKQLHMPRLPCFSSAPKPDIEINIFSDSPQKNNVTISSADGRGFKMLITDTIPRAFYLHILLRLPSLYFSRVARIFEDAEVSKPDIQRMIDASTRSGGIGWDLKDTQPNSTAVPKAAAGPVYMSQPTNSPIPAVALHAPLPFPDDWTPPLVSPALVRFKHSWEAFIDSLMREWKTLNVVSALLLSAILTMFQIPAAATDPLTRHMALLSLICALMSLSYGCVYIVRFGAMRSMYRASRWAEEARKTNTFIWWNVWVMLSLPAVWIAWSMVLFVASILSFVWRTGSIGDPEERSPLSSHEILAPRIVITLVLCIGIFYFILIIKTLKRYGYPAQPFAPYPNAMDTVPLRPLEDDGEERRGRPRERLTGGTRRRAEPVGSFNIRELRVPPDINAAAQLGSGLGLSGLDDFNLEKGFKDRVEVAAT